MTAVIDPSVWVSSLVGGWAREIGRAIDDRRLHVYASRALLDELRDVISRPRISRLVAPGEAEWLLTLLSERTTVVEPTHTEQVCRDPDDNYLLALARVADVDYLATRDEDLLTLEVHGKTKIIYPAQFMQLLSESGRGR